MSETQESLHWTAKHGKPIIFAILTLVAVGIYLAKSIPVSVFPSTDFPRIVVGADVGVYPIDQMLVTVTQPLEEALNTVPGLDHVSSITSRGSAEIDLFCDWNVDMDRTLELANAAVARVQSTLPPNAKVTANRLTFAAFPILGYSLTSQRIPQTALWEIANYTIKPRLNRAAGVSSVVVQGGQVPEFLVQPDPAKLVETGVTIPNILDAISRSNMIDSPGLIETNHQLALTLMSGQAHNTDDIAGIVIKTTSTGSAVYIKDVATVSNSVMPVYTVVTANGKPSVLINIFRQPASNTVDVANAVHNEIAQLKQDLPPGVDIRPFYDQSELVTESIASVRDAIVLGLILASLIMVLFLRDWGTSLVAGLVIPATIGVTFIAMRVLGQSFNLMTLGGLAAAVGLVIDDAIVVVENIVLHRDAGQPRAEAIRSAIREIRVPLVGSTITPIVVFLPLISINGVTGVFFRALAITVGVALLASLALALTWTPTLSHYILRGRKEGAEHHDTVPPWLMRGYERTLLFALEHRLIVALLTVLLIGGSYLCYQHTGTDLLPAMDEGGFIVDYTMPPGSSLRETNRVISHVEKILRDTPEVATTARRTGLQLGLAAVTEANQGDISVKLKPMAGLWARLFGSPPANERARSGEEVIADVRAKITTAEPLLDVEFPQLLQDMIGDLTSAPQPVVIKLFSEDGDLLRRWAPVEASTIKKLPGVVDVEDGIEATTSGTAFTFIIDPVMAARAGFTPQEVELDASAMLQGEPSTTPVVANSRSYTIRVQFPPSARQTLDTMQKTLLVSSSGKTATIGSLATLTEIPGQTEIIRENLQRSVNVTARFEGINLGAGMAAIQKAVAESNLPPSIRVQYGGQFAEQQKSFRDLVFVLALAIVLVFMVLLFEFGEFGAPVAVLSSAVLSTCGVFFALLVTGTTFNLSSFMGLIMVVGIVAKNGILLLDADQKFRAAGMAPEQSMIRAGERRLRPIMMTALATVAGMLPLAFAVGAGSQMLQPLAIAVIGGILASMILSLVVTPAVRFYLGGRNSNWKEGLDMTKKLWAASLLLGSLALAAEGFKVLSTIKIGGTGGWDYVAVDPSANRVYASHGTQVEVVDTKAGKVVGQITQLHGVHGIAVAPEFGKGFITNGQSNSVTIFDLKTLAKVGEPQTGQNPDSVCFEPKTKRIFTFNGRSNDSTAIDPKTNEVIKSLPLGGKPEECAADGTGKIYANLEDSSEIIEIDAATPAVVRHASLAPCEGPSGLAIDIKNKKLFSACSNKMMAVTDIASFKVVATPAIGPGVDGAGFDPGLGLAFSSNGGDGTLSIVKEVNGKYETVDTVTTERGARTMTVDSKNHRVYLLAAEYGPTPPAEPGKRAPRPPVLPDSFRILVVGK